MTSGWLATISSHSKRNEPFCLSPKQLTPPANSTISGIQCPPHIKGSTHSRWSTRGLWVTWAALAITVSMRACSPATREPRPLRYPSPVRHARRPPRRRQGIGDPVRRLLVGWVGQYWLRQPAESRPLTPHRWLGSAAGRAPRRVTPLDQCRRYRGPL